MSDKPVVNTNPPDLTCPFCRVALVGGPQWWDCPECKTYSRNVGRILSCVVCGEDAYYAIPDGDYKFLTVCSNHVYPPYRIRLYLAVEDFGAALRESGIFRAIYSLLEHVDLWLSRK